MPFFGSTQNEPSLSRPTTVETPLNESGVWPLATLCSSTSASSRVFFPVTCRTTLTCRRGADPSAVTVSSSMINHVDIDWPPCVWYCGEQLKCGPG